MAVKASATITLFDVVDVDSVTTYYKLQSSTAAAPAKPTTDTPNGWSTTEPTYTEGSTNTLYIVIKTKFSDGTFEYTPVSKSSSYEAAKNAYNKAKVAQDAAREAQNTANLSTGDPDNYSQLNDINSSRWDFTYDNTADGHWYTMKTLCRDKFISQYYDCLGGEQFVIEYDISTSCKANKNQSGDPNIDYVGTAIGIYQYNDEKKSCGILYANRVNGSESAPVRHVSKVVGGLSKSARRFRVFVQTDAWNTFSGFIKIRNLRVRKLFIKSVDVEYYLSNSNTSLSGGTWSTTAPVWVNGKYMWQRTVTVDNVGAIYYSPSQNGVCIAGAQGKTGNTGATGVGVSTLKELYYLSNSNTTAPAIPTVAVTSTSTGTKVWTTKCPTYVKGYYYWTCTEVLYTNNTRKWTTAILASGLNNPNEKIENLQIGGINLIKGTKNFGNEFIGNIHSTLLSNKYNECSIRSCDASSLTTGYLDVMEYYTLQHNIVLKPGEEYCFSFWIKGVIISEDKNIDNINCYFYGPKGYATACVIDSVNEYKNNNYNDGCSKLLNNDFLSKDWKRYWVVWKINPNATDAQINLGKSILIRVFRKNSVEICGCKFEKGNKPTDWSPSPEDSESVISNSSEPTDTTKIWFNTTNNMFYKYNLTSKKWDIINDVSDEIADLKGGIADAKNYADQVGDNINKDLVEHYYTTTETDEKIRTANGITEENYTKLIKTEVVNGNKAYLQVTELQACIKRGIDPTTGKPFMTLSNGDENGYSLRLENNQIIIYKGKDPVSIWQSDKFDVAMIITRALSLGKFDFIINQDESISFRKVR